MKLSDGIEQAIHSVAMLSGLSERNVLSAASLAEFHGVSTSYLLKHLQALSKGGILETVPGPKGGYRLAKSPDKISLADIVYAIEGSEPAFRCKNIRRRGPKPASAAMLKKPCSVNVAMLRAEKAYKKELKTISIADIIEDVNDMDDGTIAARGCLFLEQHERINNSH